MSRATARPALGSVGEAGAELRQLYDHHAPYLRRLISRLLGPGLDPDDVLQEVFVIAWRHLGELRLDASRAWLCQIAVRRAASWRRRAFVRRFLGFEVAQEPVDPHTPDLDVETREANEAAYAILQGMAEKRRTVFILFELLGLSGQEIAQVLGCPLKTVHTRLFRARRDFIARYDALHGGLPDEATQ